MRFLSPASRNSTTETTKPETIVIGEGVSGIRERFMSEPIHYRSNDANPICSVCHKPASVWLASEVAWELHPARCC